LLLLAACASEEPGIAPDRGRFYFPTGLAVDPARPLLYVANSNADLKFNGGTVSVLNIRGLPTDLSRVGELVSQNKLDCEPGRTDLTSWECDETQFVIKGATIRIGDFPSQVHLTSDGKRLFVPVRGQDYLAWVDIVDVAGDVVDLRCNDDVENGCGAVEPGSNCDAWDCDAKHRVNYATGQRESLPEEPFGMLINELAAVHVQKGGRRRTCRDGLAPGVPCDCGGAKECVEDTDEECCVPPPDKDSTHIYVTHLLGGEISFFASRANGVELVDIRGGFFTPQNGIQGGFSMAAQTPGDKDGRVYVSSRVDSVLASFRIRDNNTIVDDSRVVVGALSPGSDNRGIAFSPGGDRMYVVNRQPPSLVAFDMSAKAGLPKGEPMWVEEVCSEPSLLRLAPERDLAYVVCFGTAQIHVVDTATGKVVDQISTGKGPNELVIDRQRSCAFVANFLENSVGVIDLDPSHSTYHRMVLRIGLQQNLVKN
jgi:DNA-binding beta-propeller fold protein YncE